MTKRPSTRSLVFCALFAALIAVGAFIQIPLPLVDYFTLQFLFVLLAGMVLGPRLGALSVLVYLAIGLAGVPVFAAGGGIGYVLRPTFGYLIGFVIAAFVAGAIVRAGERRESAATLREQPTTTNEQSAASHPGRRVLVFVLAAFAGMLVTYVIGLGYKYAILHYYVRQNIALLAVITAELPLDLPGDVVLCLISIAAGPRLRNAYRNLEATRWNH